VTADQKGGSGQAFPPRKHPDAASRVYDGQALIVLPHSHQYKVLNQVGSRVWELIDGVRSPEDIARIVESEYEVTYEEALDDVKSFLSDLEGQGMLHNGKPDHA